MDVRENVSKSVCACVCWATSKKKTATLDQGERERERDESAGWMVETGHQKCIGRCFEHINGRQKRQWGQSGECKEKEAGKKEPAGDGDVDVDDDGDDDDYDADDRIGRSKRKGTYIQAHE